MIPQFNAEGVLPPFLGDVPGRDGALMSPHETSILDVADRFGHTPMRREILRGLLSYRAALREIGFIDGFQWIDGSFVENIEASPRRRAPQDIDIVTFARRPLAHQELSSWEAHSRVNTHLLHDRAGIRARYHCDAFMVDLDAESERIINRAQYWLGLFSHQRDTFLWKGTQIA